MIYPTSSSKPLFSEGDLRQFLDQRIDRAKADVEAVPALRLLGADDTVLADEVLQRHTLLVPAVRWDDREVHEPREVDVDVSRERDRAGFSRGRQLIAKGIEILMIVPFDGDPELLRYHPNRYGAGPPYASVQGNELHFGYTLSRLDDDGQKALKNQIDQDGRLLSTFLAGVGHDVGVHHENLQREVTQAIAARRRRLGQSNELMTKLGMPIRRRPEPDRPKQIPLARRRVAAGLVTGQGTAANDDPVLEIREYDYILDVLANMGLAMERSPTTFRNLTEPELRDFFLVVLNGHYEGAALGEAFNGSGKTDILIRVKNRNVFVAECKFWDGPRSVTAALDQLLGYTTWRDTKTALILFNKRKDFSSVLSKIQSAVASHVQFKQALAHRGETHLRYVFSHSQDAARDLYLAVLAFDVPVPGVQAPPAP
jgi:hypothetical protein